MSGGASITTPREAINWFLETCVEPHTLALAQDQFIWATKEDEETVETFARRLRSLSASCDDTHSEGTMKHQLIQGLPEFLQMDAFVHFGPACTYKKVVTYTAGKVKAAKGVVKLAKENSKIEDGGRRALVMLRPAAPRPLLPTMAFGGTAIPSGDGKAAAIQPQDQPTLSAWAYEPDTRHHLASRAPEGRGRLRWYVWWQAGHMAHQCPKLPEAQRENAVTALDAFLRSTRGH